MKWRGQYSPTRSHGIKYKRLGEAEPRAGPWITLSTRYRIFEIYATPDFFSLQKKSLQFSPISLFLDICLYSKLRTQREEFLGGRKSLFLSLKADFSRTAAQGRVSATLQRREMTSPNRTLAWKWRKTYPPTFRPLPFVSRTYILSLFLSLLAHLVSFTYLLPRQALASWGACYTFLMLRQLVTNLWFLSHIWFLWLSQGWKSKGDRYGYVHITLVIEG